MNTGGITEYLCNSCKCYGIIRNYNNYDDPNNDDFGYGLAYKRKILEIIRENNIKLVLDIHGCSNFHDFEFCLGTDGMKNLNGQYRTLDILKEGLSFIGKTSVDSYFKASTNGNVSKYVSTNSCAACVQLEISTKFRKENEYLQQLILAMQLIIKNINERVLKEPKVRSDILVR